jgi:two-component SAPR family response regulator
MVIFVTAHDEYAVAAVELNARDYQNIPRRQTAPEHGATRRERAVRDRAALTRPPRGRCVPLPARLVVLDWQLL